MMHQEETGCTAPSHAHASPRRPSPAEPCSDARCRRASHVPNGRFDLQLFPNNQLGGDSDMFSQLRAGALECFSLSGVNVLSTLIPSASIWGVGFAFPNYQTLWTALDGKLGARLRAQINKAGFVVMDKIWDNG